MALTFDNLKVHLIPRVKSCPAQIINQRLYWAAREFLSRTEVWRHVQTQSVVAAQESYTLSLPAGSSNAEIKRLSGAWYGTDSADMADSDAIDVDNYKFVVENTMTFYTAYTSALTNGLTTEVVLIPDLFNASEIPARYMDEWGIRGFMTLAIADLKTDKDQPWYDIEGARKYMGDALKSMGEAKRQNIVKRKAGDLRVVPRWFA